MGNDICQRLYSQDIEEYERLFEGNYFKKMGMRLLHSKNSQDYLVMLHRLSIEQNNHFFKQVFDLPEKSADSLFNRMSKIKRESLLRTDPSIIAREDLIKPLGTISSISEYNEYDLIKRDQINLQLTLHNWFVKVKDIRLVASILDQRRKGIKPPQNNDEEETIAPDFLESGLKMINEIQKKESETEEGLLDSEFSNEFDKFMDFTLESFIDNFGKAVLSQDIKLIKIYLRKLTEATKDLSFEQKFLIQNKKSVKIYEQFQWISLQILSILNKKLIGDLTLSQDIYNCLIKLAFYFGSVRIHLLILNHICQLPSFSVCPEIIKSLESNLIDIQTTNFDVSSSLYFIDVKDYGLDDKELFSPDNETRLLFVGEYVFAQKKDKIYKMKNKIDTDYFKVTSIYDKSYQMTFTDSGLFASFGDLSSPIFQKLNPHTFELEGVQFSTPEFKIFEEDGIKYDPLLIVYEDKDIEILFSKGFVAGGDNAEYQYGLTVHFVKFENKDNVDDVLVVFTKYQIDNVTSNAKKLTLTSRYPMKVNHEMILLLDSSKLQLECEAGIMDAFWYKDILSIVFKENRFTFWVNPSSGRILSLSEEDLTESGEEFIVGFEPEKSLVWVASANEEDPYSFCPCSLRITSTENIAPMIWTTDSINNQSSLTNKDAKISLFDDLDDDSELSEIGDLECLEEDGPSRAAQNVKKVKSDKFNFRKSYFMNKDSISKNKFIFLYIDFLTRSQLQFMVPEFHYPCMTMTDEECRNCLFHFNTIENGNQYYSIVMQILIDIYKSDFNDLRIQATLGYILTSLEDHIYIARYFKRSTNNKKLIDSKTRKNLIKLMTGLKTKIVDNLLEDIHNPEMIVSKIEIIIEHLKVLDSKVKYEKKDYSSLLKQILNNQKVSEFDIFRELLDEIIDKIGDNDRKNKILEEISDMFSTQCSNLMDLEIKCIIQMFENPKESINFSQFKLQQNMLICLQAIIQLNSLHDMSKIYEQIIDQYFLKIKDLIPQMLTSINENKKNIESLSKERSKNDSIYQFLNRFEEIVADSYIFNFMSVIFSLSLYQLSPVLEQATVKIQKQTKHLLQIAKLIQSIYSRVDHNISKNKIQDLELVGERTIYWSSEEMKDILQTGSTNLLNFRIKEESKELMKPNEFIVLLRLAKFKHYGQDYEVTDMIPEGIWTYETKDQILKNLKPASYMIQYHSKDMNTDLTLEVEVSDQSWKKSSTFINFVKVLTVNMIENMKNKQNQQQSEVTLKIGNKLDSLSDILSSNLFFNGINITSQEEKNTKIMAIFYEFVPNNTKSELETCKYYLKTVFDYLDMNNESIQEVYEQLLQLFQNRIKKKMMRYNFGHQEAMTCIGIIFLVYLHHFQAIDALIEILDEMGKKDIEEVKKNESIEEFLTLFEDSYLQCNKFRMKIGLFETKKEFYLMLNKLLLLLMIEPYNNWSLNQEETKLANIKVQDQNGSNNEDQSFNNINSYLSTLKSNEVENDLQEKSLSTLIKSFINIYVEAKDIVDLMIERKAVYLKTQTNLETIEGLESMNVKGVVSPLVLSSFRRIMQSDSSTLSPLTDSYAGVNQKLICEQVSYIKNLIISFVDIICSQDYSEEIKLEAIDNLKWDYKGREIEIVQSIDIRRMWEACKESDRLLNSLIELSQILANYSIRKIKSVTEKTQDDSFDQLPQLSRTNSEFNDNSMSKLLSDNLELFLEILELNREVISKVDCLNFTHYKTLLDSKKVSSGMIGNLLSFITSVMVRIYSLLFHLTYLILGYPRSSE